MIPVPGTVVIKRTFTKVDIACPFIVRWPGQSSRRRRTTKALTCLTDVYATLAGYHGISLGKIAAAKIAIACYPCLKASRHRTEPP